MQIVLKGIRNKTITLPQTWNELSFKQALSTYLAITGGESFFKGSFPALPIKRIVIIKELLELTDEDMNTWEQDCRQAHGADGELMFAAELDELISCSDFLFNIQEDEETGSKSYNIKLGLTRNHYPTLLCKNEQYYGPHDNLKNLSLGELAHTFTLFESLLRDPDTATIDRLIATMWRPRKPRTRENVNSGYQGDIRLPLLHHESTIEKRMRNIQKLPGVVKSFIVFWFASCRQMIIDSYPNLFGQGSSESEGESSYGWGGVLLNLAGGLADLDNIYSQNHANALIYLSMLEDRRIKEELRIAKMKAKGKI
jgi:hypothetical protein